MQIHEGGPIVHDTCHGARFIHSSSRHRLVGGSEPGNCHCPRSHDRPRSDLHWCRMHGPRVDWIAAAVVFHGRFRASSNRYFKHASCHECRTTNTRPATSGAAGSRATSNYGTILAAACKSIAATNHSNDKFACYSATRHVLATGYATSKSDAAIFLSKS